jgi:hypothetical protein
VLIEKKSVSVNDVATIRLNSGEEIVGRVTAISFENNQITLTKPIHVLAQMVRQDDGSVAAAIQFAPFLYSVLESSSFVFDFAKLALAPIRTNPDVTQSYLAATSSLAMPQTPGLLRP